MRALALVVAAAAGVTASRTDVVWTAAPPSGGPVPAPPPVTPQLRAEGAKLYADRCLPCHGRMGDGRGPLATHLSMPPTDFTRGVFKLRTTLPGTPPSDNDLFRTITRGLHGTPMMPWKELPARQRWALVAEIKNLSRRFSDEPQTQPLDPSPSPPDETEGLRAKGQRLYGLYRCGACHGERGDANGPAAVLYRNVSAGRFVRIRDLSRGEFVRGGAFADIFLSLRTGFDGTPMGSYNDLPADDLWALAAYVRTLVRQPTGAAAVPGAGGRATRTAPTSKSATDPY